jgi:hypothetical protein
MEFDTVGIVDTFQFESCKNYGHFKREHEERLPSSLTKPASHFSS